MKFVVSSGTFDYLMSTIGMRRIFSSNYFGIFRGLYHKGSDTPNSDKLLGFSVLRVYTYLVLSYIDPLLYWVYRGFLVSFLLRSIKSVIR